MWTGADRYITNLRSTVILGAVGAIRGGSVMSQRPGAAAYAVASGDIVSEDFDGEFVVLDLGSGKYYSMDAAASALWRAITAGVSMQALVDAVGSAEPATSSSPVKWVTG